MLDGWASLLPAEPTEATLRIPWRLPKDELDIRYSWPVWVRCEVPALSTEAESSKSSPASNCAAGLSRDLRMEKMELVDARLKVEAAEAVLDGDFGRGAAGGAWSGALLFRIGV